MKHIQIWLEGLEEPGHLTFDGNDAEVRFVYAWSSILQAMQGFAARKEEVIFIHQEGGETVAFPISRLVTVKGIS